MNSNWHRFNALRAESWSQKAFKELGYGTLSEVVSKFNRDLQEKEDELLKDALCTRLRINPELSNEEVVSIVRDLGAKLRRTTTDAGLYDGKETTESFYVDEVLILHYTRKWNTFEVTYKGVKVGGSSE